MDERITDTQKINIIRPVTQSHDQDSITDKDIVKITNNFTGKMKEKWIEFLSKKQPNDQIHNISSPTKSWSKKMGYKGYVIVRNNKVIEEFITIRN